MTRRRSTSVDLDESFWWRVDKSSSVVGCWLWNASDDGGAGYGRVWWNGRTVLAHRLVYEKLIGPIPPGFEIDHLCANPKCVRPEHLEPVTPSENQRRKRRGPSFEAIRRRGEEVALIRARRGF